MELIKSSALARLTMVLMLSLGPVFAAPGQSFDSWLKNRGNDLEGALESIADKIGSTDDKSVEGKSTGEPKSSAIELDRAEVIELQIALTAHGYDVGPADGIAGGKTYAAASNYSQSAGTPWTGELTRETLDELRSSLRTGKVAHVRSEPAKTEETLEVVRVAPVVVKDPDVVNSSRETNSSSAVAGNRVAAASQEENPAMAFIRGNRERALRNRIEIQKAKGIDNASAELRKSCERSGISGPNFDCGCVEDSYRAKFAKEPHKDLLRYNHSHQGKSCIRFDAVESNIYQKCLRGAEILDGEKSMETQEAYCSCVAKDFVTQVAKDQGAYANIRLNYIKEMRVSAGTSCRSVLNVDAPATSLDVAESEDLRARQRKASLKQCLDNVHLERFPDNKEAQYCDCVADEWTEFFIAYDPRLKRIPNRKSTFRQGSVITSRCKSQL